MGLFTQQGVVTCFRRLFPGDWFQDFKFPMIEDLLNQAPFCEFPRWRDQRDLKADGPLGPHLAGAALRQRQRHAEGQQAGALSHKAALYASRPKELPRLREQSLDKKVGERPRTFQTPAIRKVTCSRDIGLTALLVILTSWADVTYPYGLVAGLPAVGTAPPCGVFPEQRGRLLTMEDVLDNWETHNYKTIAALKPGKHESCSSNL